MSENVYRVDVFVGNEILFSVTTTGKDENEVIEEATSIATNEYMCNEIRVNVKYLGIVNCVDDSCDLNHCLGCGKHINAFHAHCDECAFKHD